MGASRRSCLHSSLAVFHCFVTLLSQEFATHVFCQSLSVFVWKIIQLHPLFFWQLHSSIKMQWNYKEIYDKLKILLLTFQFFLWTLFHKKKKEKKNLLPHKSNSKSHLIVVGYKSELYIIICVNYTSDIMSYRRVWCVVFRHGCLVWYKIGLCIVLYSCLVFVTKWTLNPRNFLASRVTCSDLTLTIILHYNLLCSLFFGPDNNDQDCLKCKQGPVWGNIVLIKILHL